MHVTTRLLQCAPSAWHRPTVVVDLPSPRGVGVIPATTTALQHYAFQPFHKERQFGSSLWDKLQGHMLCITWRHREDNVRLLNCSEEASWCICSSYKAWQWQLFEEFRNMSSVPPKHRTAAATCRE